MKILAIADRPTRRPSTDILQDHKVDMIVTLGDLSRQELLALEQVVDIPKVGVYGNHCSGNYFDGLGIRNLHLQTFEHMGVTFGGFEGSVRYKESSSAIMYTQEEATKLLQGFPRVDVMLAHCPPFGINDEPEGLAHQGLHAVRTYLETMRPAYFFHGHTYPDQETVVRNFGETEIIYVFQDRIVDIAV